MDNLKNILDLTRTSVIVAVIIFIFAAYVSKYLIGMYEITDSEQDSEKEGTNIKTIIYSILFGSMCSFGYLAIFKYLTRDNCDILTDPFCSKLNIV